MPLSIYLNTPLDTEAFIGTDRVTAMEDTLSYHEQLEGQMNTDDMFRYMYYTITNEVGQGDSVMHVTMKEAGSNYFTMEDETLVTKTPDVVLDVQNNDKNLQTFELARGNALMSGPATISTKIAYGRIYKQNTTITNIGRGITPTVNGTIAEVDGVLTTVAPALNAVQATVAVRARDEGTLQETGLNRAIPAPRAAVAACKISHHGFIRVKIENGEWRGSAIAQQPTCKYEVAPTVNWSTLTKYGTTEDIETLNKELEDDDYHNNLLFGALTQLYAGVDGTDLGDIIGRNSTPILVEIQVNSDSEKTIQILTEPTNGDFEFKSGGARYTGYAIAELQVQDGKVERPIGSLYDMELKNHQAGQGAMGYRGYSAGTLSSGQPDTIFQCEISAKAARDARMQNTEAQPFVTLDTDGTLTLTSVSGTGYRITDYNPNDSDEDPTSFKWTDGSTEIATKDENKVNVKVTELEGALARVNVLPTKAGAPGTTEQDFEAEIDTRVWTKVGSLKQTDKVGDLEFISGQVDAINADDGNYITIEGLTFIEDANGPMKMKPHSSSTINKTQK